MARLNIDKRQISGNINIPDVVDTNPRRAMENIAEAKKTVMKQKDLTLSKVTKEEREQFEIGSKEHLKKASKTIEY